MLQDPPKFYHLNCVYDRRITELYCLRCYLFLAASPNLHVLSIVETVHICKQLAVDFKSNAHL